MNELSKYTDKELRQELYMRNKKNKISEKDKEKCLNCVHRICYSKAIRLDMWEIINNPVLDTEDDYIDCHCDILNSVIQKINLKQNRYETSNLCSYNCPYNYYYRAYSHY